MKTPSASVTFKLHGGPFNGKSAVAYGAQVGSLIDVKSKNYRVTKIEPVPGWNEMVGSATYVEKKAPPKVRVPARTEIS